MDRLEKAERMEERLINLLGYEELMKSLSQAMTVDQKLDFYDYIARMNDVDFDF